MLDAFCEGLCRSGYDMEHICIHDLTVSLVFDTSVPGHFGHLTRFHRRLSQCLNRMYCKLYIWVTKPFTCTDSTDTAAKSIAADLAAAVRQSKQLPWKWRNCI